jgi:hypothetical protein
MQQLRREVLKKNDATDVKRCAAHKAAMRIFAYSGLHPY